MVWSWETFGISIAIGILVGCFIGISIMCLLTYSKCNKCSEDKNIRSDK